MTNLEAARTLFAAAITNGLSEDTAAQAVWTALKPLSARAPRWDEAQSGNSTGTRRIYRSPLGELLRLTDDYGQHSAKWRRTVRSHKEAEEVRETVLAALR
jgi:hypothetical protein